MTTYRLRIPKPGNGAVLEVDDHNRWRVIETDEELPDSFLSLLATIARSGSPSGGMPYHTRYANGVIDVFGGELISTTPPIESVEGRIY
ncbi:MAG: hypothetical protein F4Y50_09080 [Dehalococcoidia bacterium]|nr:hypothetical protein [Dehalococcoidia bacterium]MYD49932.1 hypothetical protein [Dehalococcoidia bacterium]